MNKNLLFLFIYLRVGDFYLYIFVNQEFILSHTPPCQITFNTLKFVLILFLILMGG